VKKKRESSDKTLPSATIRIIISLVNSSLQSNFISCFFAIAKTRAQIVNNLAQICSRVPTHKKSRRKIVFE
jgi:hypothetical protein